MIMKTVDENGIRNDDISDNAMMKVLQIIRVKKKFGDPRFVTEEELNYVEHFIKRAQQFEPHLKKIYPLKLVEGKQIRIKFGYVHDLDTNGLLYFLGCNGDIINGQYMNPVDNGMISIKSSPMAKKSQSVSFFVGRRATICCVESGKNPYFSINLKNAKIKLSNYTLRNGNERLGDDTLRSWELQGSNDGKNWKTIKTHKNDRTLAKYETHTWSVKSNTYYSRYRIYMTDKNNSGKWSLSCCGLELYGDAVASIIILKKRSSNIITLKKCDSKNKNNELTINLFNDIYNVHRAFCFGNKHFAEYHASNCIQDVKKHLGLNISLV
eukprot:163864_1